MIFGIEGWEAGYFCGIFPILLTAKLGILRSCRGGGVLLWLLSLSNLLQNPTFPRPERKGKILLNIRPLRSKPYSKRIAKVTQNLNIQQTISLCARAAQAHPFCSDRKDAKNA